MESQLVVRGLLVSGLYTPEQLEKIAGLTKKFETDVQQTLNVRRAEEVVKTFLAEPPKTPKSVFEEAREIGRKAKGKLKPVFSFMDFIPVKNAEKHGRLLPPDRLSTFPVPLALLLTKEGKQKLRIARKLGDPQQLARQFYAARFDARLRRRLEAIERAKAGRYSPRGRIIGEKLSIWKELVSSGKDRYEAAIEMAHEGWGL
jgi:hypothetical protein